VPLESSTEQRLQLEMTSRAAGSMDVVREKVISSSEWSQI